MTGLSTHETGCGPAVDGCLEACERCRILVDATTGRGATPAAYGAISPHLRHCLDHFVCFFRGVESGAIDYDARDRDERLEQDPQYLVSILDGVVDRLRTFGSAAAARGLAVRQEVAPGGQARTVKTTVERELIFLSSHTIHHIAIMSLIAERAGVQVPGGLGIAFSTESYMQRGSAPARGATKSRDARPRIG